MKNPLTWLIVACIVIGLLAALCIQQGCQKITYKNLYKQSQKQWYDCAHAPIEIHDSIVYIDTGSIRWLKPTQIIVHDTPEEFKNPKYCSRFFSDSLKYTKGILVGKIKYEIAVKDCEVQVKFPQIILPVDYHSETKTVLYHDTVLFYKPKLFHFGLYTDMTLNNFQSFPGLGLGAQLIIKDQVTVQTGAMYMDKMYWNVRIGLLFK